MLAANGIAAALLARETTGRGRAVETSLMAGALLYQTKVTGERLDRHVFQTHPSGSAPFYSIYPCADGQWVQLGCVHIGFITTCAKVLGIGELIAEPRFKVGQGGAAPQDDAELRATLTRILQSKPYAEWALAFEAADVPFAPARQTEEGLTDPQVLHNRMVTTLEDPGVGPVTQMGVPIRLSETPGRVAGPRPAALLAAKDLPGFPPPAGAPATSRAEATDPPPLAGVRILEITNLIAGPTAGRILADLGADVIKLEPPGGDMSRPIARTYFYCVNFNKRSISVDTSTDAGKSIVQRIAAKADALIANLRPHATARMGVGPAVNPRLIETHMTGYGWTGPYAKRPGIDPLAQALMGMSRAQGGPDNPPVFPAQLAPTDYTNGAMGALGTILALIARARFGIVQRVDSDLLAGGYRAELGLVHALCRQAGAAAGRQGPIRALTLPSPLPRAGRVDLRRGRDRCAAPGPVHDVRFRRCRSRPSCYRKSPGRHPNATPFAMNWLRWLRNAPWPRRLRPCGRRACLAARLRQATATIFLAIRTLPQMAWSRSASIPRPASLRVAWQLVQFADTRGSIGLPTPLLGEHTSNVLREIGYSESEIRSLHADGVVKTEPM